MKKYSHSPSFYRKKIKMLLKDKTKYILTGLSVVIVIGTITVFQLRNKNILGVFSFDSSEDSPIAVSDTAEEIKNFVVSKAIDYVSPSINKDQRLITSSGLSRPEENGQISAIVSEQVTYTSEKYVVQEGDSLASIALQVYGDVNAWVRIAQANNITNPDNVEVGSTLIIPR